MQLTLDESLKKGIAAHQAGQIQEADKFYTAILNAQPKHPDANHNMGLLLVSVGNLEQALTFFNTAIGANIGIEQHWISYINALIDLNRVKDAQKVIKKGIKKGINKAVLKKIGQRMYQNQGPTSPAPEPSPHQLQLVIDRYNRGELQETLVRIQELLAMFPTSIILLNIQGSSFTLLKQFDQAITSYTRAIKIEPDYAESHFNLGNALTEKHDLFGAIDSYRQALLIKPDFVQVYINLGKALNNLGDLDGAIDSYKQAIVYKPDYAEAHTNLGNVFSTKREFDKSVKSHRQALKIKPDFAQAHNNMGSMLDAQGDFEGAMASYRQAISCKSDYAGAYTNLGNALKNIGDFEGAIDSHRQAVTIKPEFSEAHVNLGMALMAQGDLDGAINSFKQAINIESDLSSAWDRLFVGLKAAEPQSLSLEDHLPLLTQKNLPKSVQIKASLLRYMLNRGSSRADASFNKAINLLATVENPSIENPDKNVQRHGDKPDPPEHTVALLHFGRSGTGLLHSLIDNHLQVSTLPSIYLSEFFDAATWGHITVAGWHAMPNRFIALYQVLFDATVSNPVPTIAGQVIVNMGEKEGMTRVGRSMDEALMVDRDLFREELHRLMTYYDQLDASDFFQLVHCAYEKALHKVDGKHLLFYHIHNPGTYAKLNFIRCAPDIKWLMMVREPVQSCESWVRENFVNNDHMQMVIKIVTMLFQIDEIAFLKQRSVGLRLEDLKTHPKETICALCAWMGIEEQESLYEMTAQGKKWWGDPSSPDYGKEAMTPFGNASIKRKVGSIFSGNDQFILRTLFYPFSVRFGYMNENAEQFNLDLQEIRPMLYEMFDFERVIAKETQTDVQQFMKSGSYRYLRTCLIERWETLNEFNTYPNMLEPLSIGNPINHD